MVTTEVRGAVRLVRWEPRGIGVKRKHIEVGIIQTEFELEHHYASRTTTRTLQSLMNTKVSPFWPCHENGLIKTLQKIPHNLYVSFKSASLYCGLG